MATNQVYANAQHIPLPVPSGTKSGDPVLVGALVGVAIIDREADGAATVWRDGAWNLTVTGEVTVIGAPVYIAAAGQGTRQTKLTVTAGSDVLFGYALATKGAADGVIPVAIAQV
jgi:predicted RecA/RadA family phage recombinase